MALQQAPEHGELNASSAYWPWPSGFRRAGIRGFSRSTFKQESDQERDTPASLPLFGLVAVSLSALDAPSTSPARTGTASKRSSPLYPD